MDLSPSASPQTMPALEDRPARRRWRTIFTALALLGLYGVGVAHWVWFFNGGELTLQAYDWPKEAMYFQVLQTALREDALPYHIQMPAEYVKEFPHLAQGRFLGLPETTLSPQILLLYFLDVNRFILAHNLILYSLGFAGSLLLWRRYRLGLLPFAVFFILFNFNGYITAHLGAGHSMWSGYFLLPFFCLYILEWVEQTNSFVPALKLALVLFAMLLQGSFHMVVWCWLFVVSLVAFNPRFWRQGLLALGFSGLLAAFRLLPTAVTFWGFRDYNFNGGYPTLTDLLSSFIIIREPLDPWVRNLFTWTPGWEYDMYLGLLGLGVLGYFGIYRRWDQGAALRPYQYPALDKPIALLALFSLSYFYYVIFCLPIPFANSERVTARFIIIPVVMLLTLAAIRMARVLETVELSFQVKVLVGIALVEVCFSLFTHSSYWAITGFEHKEQTHWHPLQQATILQISDPVYTWSARLSAGISLAALLAWAYLLLHYRRAGQTRDKVETNI
jgi:hypothetical protein